jgi:hypothetical protein
MQMHFEGSDILAIGQGGMATGAYMALEAQVGWDIQCNSAEGSCSPLAGDMIAAVRHQYGYLLDLDCPVPFRVLSDLHLVPNSGHVGLEDKRVVVGLLAVVVVEGAEMRTPVIP